MSLQDPTKKMSKSDDNQKTLSHYLTNQMLQRKIKSAVTDSDGIIKFDKDKNQEFLTYYNLFKFN